MIAVTSNIIGVIYSFHDKRFGQPQTPKSPRTLGSTLSPNGTKCCRLEQRPEHQGRSSGSTRSADAGLWFQWPTKPGVLDTDSRLKDREQRLKLTTHAEANCVAFAARAGICLNGATVYVWPLMTCSQCAALLIQAGIGKVVVPDYVEPQRWQESFDLARAMFIEAGVSVHRISMSGDLNEEVIGLP